jgi:hypothetical protein
MAAFVIGTVDKDTANTQFAGATNPSTQHERNTFLPASFASDLNASAIGLVALCAAVVAVVVMLGAMAKA